MTYTALLTLTLLRDDYTRLDRKGLWRHVHELQQTDGSFLCTPHASEQDVRFTYCACAIAYIVDDWTMLDRTKAEAYLAKCRHYEGAYGQEPGLESHGGSTYCVVAALALMQRLGGIDDRLTLARWILSRQVPGSGFQGRVEKAQDACYSFWCGASAQILGCHDGIDAEADVRFLLSAQSPMGGIAKAPGEHPDVLHSYLSYVALAMHVEDRGVPSGPFGPMSVALNLSRTSLDWVYTHLWKEKPATPLP